MRCFVSIRNNLTWAPRKDCVNVSHTRTFKVLWHILYNMFTYKLYIVNTNIVYVLCTYACIRTHIRNKIENDHCEQDSNNDTYTRGINIEVISLPIFFSLYVSISNNYLCNFFYCIFRKKFYIKTILNIYTFSWTYSLFPLLSMEIIM